MGDYNPFDPNADQTKKGWLTAILELGAWVGAILSGFVAEYLSRKYGIILATVVFVIGVVIQATAITPAGPQATLAGRFITGMGVGSLSMIVPTVCLSFLSVLLLVLFLFPRNVNQGEIYKEKLRVEGDLTNPWLNSTTQKSLPPKSEAPSSQPSNSPSPSAS